jgi:hypothetical protein
MKYQSIKFLIHSKSFPNDTFVHFIRKMVSMSLALHKLIENCNVLQRPTDQLKGYFRSHPVAYKVALLANHLFRTASMIGLQMILPFSPLANMGICFTGSLFYRLTVETNCAYKFALPAFAGSLAAPMGIHALFDFIHQTAFESLQTFAQATMSIVPLTAYVVYIALTVNYDVDLQCSKS